MKNFGHFFLLLTHFPLESRFFVCYLISHKGHYGKNRNIVRKDSAYASTCGRKFLTSLCLSGYVDDKERWGIGEMGQKLQCSLLLQRSNAPMLSFTRLLP